MGKTTKTVQLVNGDKVNISPATDITSIYYDYKEDDIWKRKYVYDQWPVKLNIKDDITNYSVGASSIDTYKTINANQTIKVNNEDIWVSCVYQSLYPGTAIYQLDISNYNLSNILYYYASKSQVDTSINDISEKTNTSINNIKSALNTSINNINTSISTLKKDVDTSIKNISNYVKENITNISSNVSTFINNVSTSITNISTHINTFIKHTDVSIKNISTNISALQTNYNKIKSDITSIKNILNDIDFESINAITVDDTKFFEYIQNKQLIPGGIYAVSFSYTDGMLRDVITDNIRRINVNNKYQVFLRATSSDTYDENALFAYKYNDISKIIPELKISLYNGTEQFFYITYLRDKNNNIGNFNFLSIIDEKDNAIDLVSGYNNKIMGDCDPYMIYEYKVIADISILGSNNDIHIGRTTLDGTQQMSLYINVSGNYNIISNVYQKFSNYNNNAAIIGDHNIIKNSHIYGIININNCIVLNSIIRSSDDNTSISSAYCSNSIINKISGNNTNLYICDSNTYIQDYNNIYLHNCFDKLKGDRYNIFQTDCNIYANNINMI